MKRSSLRYLPGDFLFIKFSWSASCTRSWESIPEREVWESIPAAVWPPMSESLLKPLRQHKVSLGCVTERNCCLEVFQQRTRGKWSMSRLDRALFGARSDSMSLSSGSVARNESRRRGKSRTSIAVGRIVSYRPQTLSSTGSAVGFLSTVVADSFPPR